MKTTPLIEKATKIKLLILDVDGILTDGSLYIGQTNECFKAFHVHDGLGLSLLLSTNIKVAIMTARQSDIVTTRLNELGITEIYQGVKNKLLTYKMLLTKYRLIAEQVAFMGDDLPDLQTLSHCGLSISVPDAHFIVKRYAAMITEKSGGCGAVREVCDFLMQAKGTFDKALSPYEALATHD